VELQSAGGYLAMEIHAQTGAGLVSIGRSVIDIDVSSTIIAGIDAQSKWTLWFSASLNNSQKYWSKKKGCSKRKMNTGFADPAFPFGASIA
jgi:hypothetical protein